MSEMPRGKMHQGKPKQRISLVWRMVIAVLSGFVIGLGLLAFKASMGEESKTWQMVSQLLFVDVTSGEGTGGIGLLYDIQLLFLNALQLGIVPLVLCSLALAIGNVEGAVKLSRIAGKGFKYFALFYVMCALFAMGVSWLAKALGVFIVDIPVTGISNAAATEPYNPLSIFLGIIPGNAFSALSDNGGVLSVIFIAIVLGIIMNHMPEQSQPVAKLLASAKAIVERYMTFVMDRVAPFAIFCMITRAFATYGLEYLASAGAYLAVGCTAGIISTFVLLPVLVMLLLGKSPLPFMRKTLETAFLTGATTSSMAGYPANVKATKSLGCAEDISSFVLPTGMVVHMPGTVVMQVIAVMFIATSAGLDVQLYQLAVAAAICVIVAVATPTVPLAGTVLIYVALSGVGFTTDACMLAYALVVAINYPVAMACIPSNTVGDAAVDVIVCKSEGTFDEEEYSA